MLRVARRTPLLLLALAVASPLMAKPLENLRTLDQLRTRFNEEADIPRLILLMSPTCPVCVAGAEWVQTNVLEANPSAEIRVFAVWFNMIAGDERSRWPGTILDDRRVVHLWDARRTVGRWYAEDPQIRATTLTDSGVVWDAYFLYGRESRWQSTPSDLIDHGSTIMASRERLREQLESLWGFGDANSHEALATCQPLATERAHREGALATCQQSSARRAHRDDPARLSGVRHACRNADRH